ncbi:hypothetical protein [Neomoorella mulderi]|uniref:Uncharacterized protein n=1 Tax=Moorella mulderi DSM 14980 TaxID=1122241 RepID=A0A151B1Y7_9FIRM|nr:hypothetical protein [Moorella mulderi]KYH33925.1 hypothetical protein MOMUL_06430 [Moorella mulderi DSM 14980]
MDGNSPRPLGAGLDTYHFQPATSQPLGSYHQPLPIEKPVGMTGVPDGPVGEIYQEAQEALSDVYHRCRLGNQLEVKNYPGDSSRLSQPDAGQPGHVFADGHA